MQIVQELIDCKWYGFSAADCYDDIPVCRFIKALYNYVVRDPLQYKIRKNTDAKSFFNHTSFTYPGLDLWVVTYKQLIINTRIILLKDFDDIRKPVSGNTGYGPDAYETGL